MSRPSALYLLHLRFANLGPAENQKRPTLESGARGAQNTSPDPSAALRGVSVSNSWSAAAGNCLPTAPVSRPPAGNAKNAKPRIPRMQNPADQELPGCPGMLRFLGRRLPGIAYETRFVSSPRPGTPRIERNSWSAAAGNCLPTAPVSRPPAENAKNAKPRIPRMQNPADQE